MKKIVSLTLTLIMLMGMLVCVPVSAESTLVQGEILNQHAEETDPDYVNLSFGVHANVAGMQIKAGTAYGADYTAATVAYNGQTANLIEMGVMFTNRADVGAAPEQSLCVGDENELDIIRIRADYLYEKPEETSCFYVARIRNIPYFARDVELTARPYFILEIEGAEQIVYSEVDRENYLDVWSAAKNVTVPAPESISLKGVVLESVTPRYFLDSTDKHTVRMEAAFTVRNDSVYGTVAGSFVEYACYDESGTVLQQKQIDLGGIAAGDTVTFTESVPTETMRIAVVGGDVPPVLPAIGSDIDVTKQKNRIRVSAASATLKEDGTYAVSLTFKNYTSNWITEETDYVKYTYYDATGTAIKTETLHIGVIDTKKNPSKTFELAVPANTAAVKITSSKIVYWTEWA